MRISGFFSSYQVVLPVLEFPELPISSLNKTLLSSTLITMERFFNTAGPVKPEKHYCLPPEERLNLEDILSLIDQEKYFILHAPRQTGKTSLLLALTQLLNRGKKYRALYVNVEPAQAYREDISSAMETITGKIADQAHLYLKDSYPQKIVEDFARERTYNNALEKILSAWSAESPKPLVIFIDEIDSLVGDTLIAVLRQLRSGYTRRPRNFPQSIILCGVRDVRDYRIHSAGTKEIITGGSAYNIKARSLRLEDFTRGETEKLLFQHTAETGQVFLPGTVEAIWEYTRGQPWLVNALAYEICFENKAHRDRTIKITPVMVEEAAEILIQRRETHLDQLTDKLREDRVRRVIQPILAGEGDPETIPEDDIQYVLDLGLIRRHGQLEIANKIYKEVIPRSLVFSTQVTIAHQTEWYVTGEGKLDMPSLLTAFQDFFRMHSESWLERFDYQEAGPQLLLQAFLQRIINGGGRVEREYALGSLRTDLLIRWPYGEKKQTIVIELKIRRRSIKTVKKEGAQQTADYMDRCGAAEGYLVIFDKSKERRWEDKIFRDTLDYNGKKILVWGM